MTASSTSEIHFEVGQAVDAEHARPATSQMLVDINYINAVGLLKSSIAYHTRVLTYDYARIHGP